MAYTIIKSNGDVLTTIQDGTINTTSTSLGLPGRNYAGYGQTLDTNFVRVIEHFAANTPPANPLKGQLWYNTALNTLNICPENGTTNVAAWSTLTTTNSTGAANIGSLSLSGNLNGVTGAFTDSVTVTNSVSTGNITVSGTASLQGTANITLANIGTTRTAVITTGSSATGGTLTGEWTVNGNSSGNAFYVTNGNIVVDNQIWCNDYRDGSGNPWVPTGTYTNANVADYLNGNNTNGTNPTNLRFNGNLNVNSVTTGNLIGGGKITGIWELNNSGGNISRIQANYADLAENYLADAVYEVGTVVEIGGEQEITIASELSENVFGVISNTAAYLMNSGCEGEFVATVALTGRLNVKTKGTVKKGDRMVSAGNGFARAASKEEITLFNTIGRALANKDDAGDGVVEVVVSIK